MKRLFKIALKKILINKFYKTYVKDNAVIIEDIENAVNTRKFRAQLNTVKDKFNHLMLYYPEYAFIFYWRTGLNKYRGLFTKDYNCKIFGSTKIEGGLLAFHPFATVINAKSIGKNFQFRNGLTIGNKNNDNSLVPVIGDNVVVGPNVVIIGKITIGDNVIIGAGSVVVKDVPSNSVIAGNPAKIIRTINE